jgi:hypothetical protein
MSLLADLLSRIKHPQTKGEVPPNLKSIVQSSSLKSSAKKKIIILSVILAVFVLAGVGALFFVKQLEQSSVTSMVDSQEPVVRENVKTGKPAINTVQTGQTQKAADSSISKVEKEPVTQITKNHATPDVKAAKSFSKPPRTVQAFRQPARIGVPAAGAWGKRTVEKQIHEEAEPSKETQIPAVQEAEKSIKIRDLQLYSAREHELKADYAKALADYKKALKADSNNISIMNSIAYAYLQLGINDASISHSQKALAINAEYVPALTNMGIALAKQEQLKEAEGYFLSALNLEPENQNVLLNLAILFEKQGKHGPSADYYKRLMGFGNIEGMFGLARIYERQGEIDQAIELYENAYAHEGIDEKNRIKVRQKLIRLMNNL